jgi:hypothetical protein
MMSPFWSNCRLKLTRRYQASRANRALPLKVERSLTRGLSAHVEFKYQGHDHCLA